MGLYYLHAGGAEISDKYKGLDKVFPPSHKSCWNRIGNLSNSTKENLQKAWFAKMASSKGTVQQLLLP